MYICWILNQYVIFHSKENSFIMTPLMSKAFDALGNLQGISGEGEKNSDKIQVLLFLK